MTYQKLPEDIIYAYKDSLRIDYLWDCDVYVPLNCMPKVIPAPSTVQPVTICNLYYEKGELEDFVRLYPAFKLRNLNWYHISRYPKLSKTFILDYFPYLNFEEVYKNNDCSESFILELLSKHPNGINKLLAGVCRGKQLSEQVLDALLTCVNDTSKIDSTKIDKAKWVYSLSRCQKLSESFIEKHISNLDLDNISEYQNLSLNFIMKHRPNFKLQFLLSNPNINKLDKSKLLLLL